jgi:hypothetical protein
MRILLGLAFVTVLALPAAQAAADSTPAPVEHTFTDADLVTGENLRPDSVDFVHRRGTINLRLIRLRTTFVPELLKDAEDL